LKKILFTLIKEHINSAIPVGSNSLVEKYKLDISPATARQRFSELEVLGYIYQPHTSAGRIPTEKAYRMYVEENILNQEKGDILKNIIINKVDDELKQVAKDLAHDSSLAVFWAFTGKSFYYTGFSNLLKQPEFAQINKVYDVSQVIDQIDEIINNFFHQIEVGQHILIGAENPFGASCSSIIIKYKSKKGGGMFGIIGPMRMNYEKSLKLIIMSLSKL
ncbi:MAG: hypothetical protein NT091_01740, partial [Candidatus Falkowbacteria bacterium]|nr:hypothetical protein [Candidatus Falkowbacteria bacterium]